jgi:hypothetical protein
MRRPALRLSAAALPLLLLSACQRSGTPDLVTAPARPPASTSSVAAAAPVDAVAPPQAVPTPAATALAIANKRAADKRASASGVAAPRTPGSARPAPGPCSGLRGAALDGCIDREARGGRVAVEEAGAPDEEFRAAQARRDRELMDREEEEARLAAAQQREPRDRDLDGDVDARDRYLADDLNRDGRVDWRDRQLARDDDPRDPRDDAVDDGREPYPDDVADEDPPPPDEEDGVIYEEPPPGDDGYYPPVR